MLIQLRTCLIASVGCLLIGGVLGVVAMLGDKPAAIPAFVQQQIKDLEKAKEEQIERAKKAESEALQATQARQQAASSLAGARDKVAKLERALRERDGNNPGPDNRDAERDALLDTVRILRESDSAKGELIAKLEVGLKDSIAEAEKWHASSDEWKKTNSATEAASRIKILALQAQLDGTKSARWRGRFEGAAVGLLAGQIPRLAGWSIKF